MASFGENLRREREMRGVTLVEISAATKISVRFLQAIEAEDFSKLPGGIFTRSFVRTYAKYLGLDEKSVLAEFQIVVQPKGDVDISRLAVVRPVASGEGSHAPVFALLLAAAMLSAGYALFRYSRHLTEVESNPAHFVGVSAAPSSATFPTPSGHVSPPSPAPGSTVAATSTASGARSKEMSATGRALPVAATPAANPAGSVVTDTESGDDGLVLQVAATERAWVAVDADGKTTFQRVLNPNEIQTLHAKESFDVTTGNAQGVVLTLNGETLKPLGRRGEVKSIHLTHDDLKNPAP